jgi:acyl transferase domain-containing protein
MAIFNRFAALGLRPTAVVGHSSGEIAASYAAGGLSLEQAMILAYYRGYVTAQQTLNGAMAAIGLGATEVAPYLELVEGVVMACENSPSSTTISGDAEQVDKVVATIKAASPDTLARRLKVDMAYHSRK